MNTVKIEGQETLSRIFDQINSALEKDESVAWTNKDHTRFTRFKGGNQVKIYTLI